ncbi:MAG: hypothetical protein K8I60_18395 [Anaerolineae bacterium]|nr:hypothetical protein [Anaerolineae bacterium]
MNWQEIREKYPHRWLVVEAYDAYTEKGKRIIDHLEVVGVFEDDWKPAWEHYNSLHHADKWREYYVLHTDRQELDILVMDEFRRIVAEE